jgi:hypothetical protein
MRWRRAKIAARLAIIHQASGNSGWVMPTIQELDRLQLTSNRGTAPKRTTVLFGGGRFLILERGFCPQPSVQKWQGRLNWLEMRLADSCRLDRDIRALIVEQPSTSVEMENGYLEHSPKTHG